MVITYPERSDERRILDDWAKTEDLPTASQVVTAEQILTARKVVNTIYVDDKVKDYIVDLVCATRDPGKYKIPAEGLIELGASPRATIFLTLAAKSHAFVQGRGYVTPQDVKSIAMDVLRHRVHVSYEAEAEEMMGLKQEDTQILVTYAEEYEARELLRAFLWRPAAQFAAPRNYRRDRIDDEFRWIRAALCGDAEKAGAAFSPPVAFAGGLAAFGPAARLAEKSTLRTIKPPSTGGCARSSRSSAPTRRASARRSSPN